MIFDSQRGTAQTMSLWSIDPLYTIIKVLKNSAGSESDGKRDGGRFKNN